jgi:ABC-2 type transport system ATP-binding protein
LSEVPEPERTPVDSAGAPALELQGLTKRFGDFGAVEDMNLVVRRGDVYGFLGPNGSGKSTTIRMILGLVRPTSGAVRIFGRPATGPGPGGRAKMAGFVEAPGFYEYLSARDNLRLLAAADRRGDKAPPLGRVLETVGLSDRSRDRVRTYSQGMKQRLAIAAALLREPEFLVLDEPTNGLDPGGMRDVRALVRQLSGDGLTIFLSTHLLAEVEQLCNRVAVVGGGRLLAEGALEEISEQARGRTEYRLVADDSEKARRVLQTQADVAVLNGRPEELEGFRPDEVVRFAAGTGGVGPVVRNLVEEGVEVLALVPARPNLEEMFLRLTEGE